MGTVNDSPANFEIASLQRMPCGLQGKLLGIVLIHRPKQQLLATDRLATSKPLLHFCCGGSR